MKIVIGVQIKKYRVHAGWSQQELATQLNVTRQTISKWELDKSYPDLESLVRLSELFAVSTDDLLGLKRTDATPVTENRPIRWTWFHRGRKSTMTKKVKWYAGGQERAQVAVGLLVGLIENLNASNEQPLRELLASYYQELVDQRSGSNLYVFDRMNLGVSRCMQKNGIVLSADNRQRMNDLLALNYIHYS
ncbi:helix-turn-helix domain-containing protein [Lactiplantibacillus daowaiensis]|uniref:Helix-turn-helix domain-containing protein n=1 Tax=Lactiplantibacillus daowaiensis TaxID=2559918 RepID=A0ABW1RYH7_9LACO|nr:helix-turn-helix domain-containing protein [Lactiplantibacillus daowaiensis]